MPSGKILTLRLETTNTIYNIKTIIQKKESIPPDEQQLMFDGEQLQNYSTISDCSIKNESTLHLERKQLSYVAVIFVVQNIIISHQVMYIQ